MSKLVSILHTLNVNRDCCQKNKQIQINPCITLYGFERNVQIFLFILCLPSHKISEPAVLIAKFDFNKKIIYIYLFVHSFINSFIYSFIHPFILPQPR